MSTMVLYWAVWLTLAAGGDPDEGIKKPAPSEKRYTKFVNECKEGIHVGCVRQGTGWLTHHKLPIQQRRAILARVANAYLSLRRDTEAEKAIMRVIKLAPCSPAPPGIPQQAMALFRIKQQQLFRSDQAPPILSHTSPATSTLREKGKFYVRATDDLQIRDVTLHYRTNPTGAYQEIPFTLVSGSRYTAQIPPKQLTSIKQLDYYITARDCANRTANNQANAAQPIKLIFEGKGSSAKAVGGGLLIATGTGLLVGSSLLLVSASTEAERLKKIIDPTAKDKLQQRVNLFQGLGWTGIVLSGIAIGVGILLLVPRKKPNYTGTPGGSDTKGNAFLTTFQ